MQFEKEKLMQKSGLHDMKHHPDGSLKIIIIHSKYFPNSDWLKAHA